mgnify:CR=1 FL=1
MVADLEVTLAPGLAVGGAEDGGFDEVRLGQGEQELEAQAAEEVRLTDAGQRGVPVEQRVG